MDTLSTRIDMQASGSKTLASHTRTKQAAKHSNGKPKLHSLQAYIAHDTSI